MSKPTIRKWRAGSHSEGCIRSEYPTGWANAYIQDDVAAECYGWLGFVCLTYDCNAKLFVRLDDILAVAGEGKP